MPSYMSANLNSGSHLFLLFSTKKTTPPYCKAHAVSINFIKYKQHQSVMAYMGIPSLYMRIPSFSMLIQNYKARFEFRLNANNNVIVNHMALLNL